MEMGENALVLCTSQSLNWLVLVFVFSLLTGSRSLRLNVRSHDVQEHTGEGRGGSVKTRE